jgi:hypothetical protein
MEVLPCLVVALPLVQFGGCAAEAHAPSAIRLTFTPDAPGRMYSVGLSSIRQQACESTF